MTESKEGGDAERGFSTRIGFIFAAVGSAVGFGSIARFPFMTAENGGAVFVLFYAVIMILVGIPMMVAEFSLGRRSGADAVGTFKVLTGDPRTKWRYSGFFYIAAAGFFLSWYAVATGWVLRYLWASFTGAYFDDPAAFNVGLFEGPDALFWTFLVMASSTAVVMGRVSQGIEKVNLVMIPTLFVMLVGLVVYAATLSDTGPGYRFYLAPDFSEFGLPTVAAATAQAFFSLSLGQGAMLTYASYMQKKQSLAANATLISVSTVSVAILAGLMVFPMLAAFGLLGGGEQGLALIFGPLPRAFADLGGMLGRLVGAVFFTVTFFAAFTSAISLMEPAVAYFHDQWKLPRWKSGLLVGEIIYGGAVLAAFSTPYLAVSSGAITNACVLLGGFMISLFIARRFREEARKEMDYGDRLRTSRFIHPWVTYVMPFVLLVLLLTSLFGAPGFLGGGEGAVQEILAFLD
ncbi:MAG: sodium-dependent transporter [Methanobacteriota archaeon]